MSHVPLHRSRTKDNAPCTIAVAPGSIVGPVGVWTGLGRSVSSRGVHAPSQERQHAPMTNTKGRPYKYFCRSLGGRNMPFVRSSTTRPFPLGSKNFIIGNLAGQRRLDRPTTKGSIFCSSYEIPTTILVIDRPWIPIYLHGSDDVFHQGTAIQRRWSGRCKATIFGNWTTTDALQDSVYMERRRSRRRGRRSSDMDTTECRREGGRALESSAGATRSVVIPFDNGGGLKHDDWT